MIVKHFLTSANESNAFVVVCEETRQAVLIDAGDFDPAILAFIQDEELKLVGIFITHAHYDHTDGLDAAERKTGACIYAGTGRVAGHPATCVSHGDDVQVGNLAGRVLAVPGHTEDSVCLAFPGHVFTGDALFAGSVGGTSSDAAGERLKTGIRKHIFSLPSDTEIHTGHGPSSTVAIESQHNPFFV
ncbi:MAG: MBL fold metallo-hydrolase [bacterium]|nr:MBL fold metallo-hydrolase [bacterium]